MKDYGADGIDIQAAMLRHAKAHPDRTTRPRSILWNQRPLWTGFELAVPQEGRFRLEFLSGVREPVQGVDVKADPGGIELLDGRRIPILRTWFEEGYEDRVEYPYLSKRGTLWTWNVSKFQRPDGSVTEEKWTGNLGFRVEQEAAGRWVFRCSDFASRPPDFTRLVFRLSILEPA